MANIDYASEHARLEAFVPGTGDFWKPEPGQYTVTALTELEDAEPYIDEKNVATPQAKFRMKISKVKKAGIEANVSDEVLWTIPIGKTKASAYGQLVNLAQINNGLLKDKEFMIVVTHDGSKNSYTIII